MAQPARKSAPPVPLAEAQERLLPLVDELLTYRTDRVALSRPGARHQVLLVRAHDIERIEAEIAELRKRVEPEPRPLWGTATVIGDVEQMLAESRREANERYEAKMADIFSDPPSGASDDEGPDAEQAPRNPRSIDLHAIPERGDRPIAATALELGYPLVTRDPEIVAVIGGEHLW